MKSIKYETMKLSEEAEERVSKLSPILRLLVKQLLDWLNQAINGECNEDAVSYGLTSISDNSNGRYRDEDLCTYDESMKILHLSNNRVGFKRLMDKNGIEQVIMSNMKVGFPKASILSLSARLKSEKKK